MNNEAQFDMDYWNTKYAEAECWQHGSDPMYYDLDEAEWICLECHDDEDD